VEAVQEQILLHPQVLQILAVVVEVVVTQQTLIQLQLEQMVVQELS
jgi:hypothetical protein